MRILILNDYATPVGGAERLTLRLRDELRARGHEARIFASSAGDGAASSFADETCFGTLSPVRAALEVVNPSAMVRLRRVLRAMRPDVVHARLMLTQLSPAIVPLLRKVPSIYHAVWYRAVCPTGTKRLPDGSACAVRPGFACLRAGCVSPAQWLPLMGQRALWRSVRGGFDAVVANSAHVAARLGGDGMRCDHVVWNGVDERPPRPALTAEPRVVFAGRLVAEKGVDTVLRAMAMLRTEHPRLTLTIVGDGPLRGALEQQAAALGLGAQVDFVGHLPPDGVERIAERAWVQVVPSLWDEPFGLVVAEAMMRGTAVVASARGGPAEVVRHGETGLLVEPGDAAGLAAALGRLAADRELAEAWGRAGRDFALRRLGMETFVERMLDIYASVVTARA